MSSFVVRLASSPSLTRSQRTLEALAAAGPPGLAPDIAEAVVHGQAEVSVFGWRTTPEQHHTPSLHIEGDTAVVGNVRLDDRVATIAQLAARGDSSTLDQSDEELLLACHRVWGDLAVANVIGDLGYVRVEKDRLLCARDIMGMRPVYWSIVDRDLIIASELASIVRLRGADTATDCQHVLEAFARRDSSLTTTPFAEISRLAPGCILKASLADSRLRVHVRRVDRLAAGAWHGSDPVPELVAHLEAAVSDRSRAIGPIACEVSGGYDSTTIAAVALSERTLSKGDIDALVAVGWSSPGQTNDESAYMHPAFDTLSAAAEQAGVAFTAREFDTTQVRPKLTEQAAASGHVVNFGRDELVGAAQRDLWNDGCRVVLTGQGGDHGLFALSPHPVDIKRVSGWSGVTRSVSVPRGTARLRATAKAILRTGAASTPTARDWVPGGISVLRSCMSLWRLDWLTSRVGTKLGFGSVMADDGDKSPAYDLSGAWSASRSLRAGQFTSPGAVAVFEGMYRTNAQGLDPRNPFLDRRVVEFVLSLPPDEIATRTDYRKLHLAAFGELLPPEVRDRKHKTMQTAMYQEFLRAEGGCSALALSLPATLGLIEVGVLGRRCRAFMDGTSPAGWQPWNTMCFDAWLEAHPKAPDEISRWLDQPLGPLARRLVSSMSRRT